MTYVLFIGDRTFSSWSLRGWLMLEKFGLPFRVEEVGLYTGTLAADLTPVAPARFVPALMMPGGEPLGDTLAMAETLAERHPEAGLWPDDPAARMRARWLVAEMHSGFAALRSHCPMALIRSYDGFRPPPEVLAELDRLQALWTEAQTRFGAGGPWLFGRYCLADVFFAPVAARIAAYGLPVGDAAAAYVAQHLADPAFRRWRAEGLTFRYAPEPHAMDLPHLPWPGPEPVPARAVAHGPAINAVCPVTGRPPTHFLEINGAIIGFATLSARDMVANDPEAFPEVAAIYHSVTKQA
ncbi:glutathione S-transferase [Rhodovulum sulfidophilum]|uniref:glutathione S-transferase n=1 Tax=Rhodovulum sulfidophilum TaxID=35806 RepID=UPI0019230B3C|nr:glutathione S-transferase [Rhodovulum sulfidophilum]MBL3595562.1 glutathione S-transferase [Rhodovulum sulfidophilum]